MNHSNKTRRNYKLQYREKNKGCPFCPPHITGREIKEFTNFVIIENGVKYDFWEGHKVTEHLLLIPKAHIKSLAELQQSEYKELMTIFAQYESDGYSVYARGVGSPRRSVEHQHTHLIKIENKRPRAILFINKPYFLFKI